jgi:uncharacterized protein (DUF1015 family)
MAHCDAATIDDVEKADSATSLKRAAENMRALERGGLTREVSDVLFVYAITHPEQPDFRQIGLGGNAPTAEIRTEAQPEGRIIRNEGVREAKALGRAHLIEATQAIIGTVNLAVPDTEGRLASRLEAIADAGPPDLETTDEHSYLHCIWLVTGAGEIDALQSLLARESEAYVADGNHRSAAAAMLGHQSFLTVFFSASHMGISPYNRLLDVPELAKDELVRRLGEHFDVQARSEAGAYQPSEARRIGFYTREAGWLELTPQGHTFDPSDAAQCVDHDIVQRCLFDAVFGIHDARDSRLTFVGANKDAAWLQARVDGGDASYAITIAAVTMQQFVDVCRQNRMMPPKSTWFEPKIRSGLVMSLLD